MNDSINKAVKVLNEGGIVIFPTDTAFGIGCRIDRKDSIQKLFQLRKRPQSQATPVLVDSISMAQMYWKHIPEDVEQKLISKYWPGALTVILECDTQKVPELVRGGTHTLGLRQPNSETILNIISHVGVPILAPSANFHGEKTPYSLDELDEELVNLVDYVVPGECTLKQASTVIDCTQTPWEILRNGAIKLEL